MAGAAGWQHARRPAVEPAAILRMLAAGSLVLRRMDRRGLYHRARGVRIDGPLIRPRTYKGGQHIWEAEYSPM